MNFFAIERYEDLINLKTYGVKDHDDEKMSETKLHCLTHSNRKSQLFCLEVTICL
jgi:hypothetical protein